MLTRRELAKISITALIAELHGGRPVTGLLRELNEEWERAGVRQFDPMRPIIPLQALGGQRDMIVATGTLGGYTAGTAPETAADTLRPYSVAIAVGAQVLEGLRETTPLPSVSTSASGSWLSSESASASASTPTFTSATLSPKTYTGVVKLSRSLQLAAAQSEPVVRRHLARLYGAAVDAATLAGPGTDGAPSGLMTVSGLGTATGTDYAACCNMLEQAVTAGADDRRAVFVSTPAVRELYQQRERGTGGSGFVWDNNIVCGKSAYAAPEMPAASAVCGDFEQVVCGFWGPGIELTVDPYSGFQTGVIAVRAIATMDVGILFPGSFCKLESIT